MSMATHCPACRTPLTPGDAVCATCGAVRIGDEWQLGMRGWSVLIGRRALVLGLIWLVACTLLAVIPSRAGGLLALFGSLLLALIVLVAGALGMRPMIFVVGWIEAATGAICGATVLIFAGSPLQASGPLYPAVVVCLVGMLVSILPALRVASRPLPPSDPRHCQKCGYSLVSLPVPRCPECGSPFRDLQLERARKIK